MVLRVVYDIQTRLITGLGEELLREEARRIIALSKLAEELL